MEHYRVSKEIIWLLACTSPKPGGWGRKNGNIAEETA
jgi:hypothetical protein